MESKQIESKDYSTSSRNKSSASDVRVLSSEFFIAFLCLSITLLGIVFAVSSLTEGTNIRFGRAANQKMDTPTETEEFPEYVPGEIIAIPADGVEVPTKEKGGNFANKGIPDSVVDFLAAKRVTEVDEVKLPTSVASQKSNLGSVQTKLDKVLKIKTTSKNKDDVLRLVEEFSNSKYFKAASPNYFYKVALTPNDPLYPQQWGLNQTNNIDINAPQAWDNTTGNEQVVVAVLDTGVDLGHPDLASRIFENPAESGANASDGQDDDGNGYIDDVHGWDVTTCQQWDTNTGTCSVPKNPGNNTNDVEGHGTFVAGIIGAVTDNSQGVAGVDHKAKIMPVKIANSQGLTTCDELLNGLIYATQFAWVSNLSLTSQGKAPCVGFDIIANFAITSRMTIVVSAGNDGTSEAVYPAASDKVIGISAIGPAGDRAFFSNYGGWVDFAGPGVNVVSTALPGNSGVCPDSDGDGYTTCNGTSAAAAYISGVAALIHSKNLTLRYNPAQILNIMANSAKDIGIAGKDESTGWGIPDAAKAITDQNTADLPISQITYPYDGMPVGSDTDIKGSIDIPGVTDFDVEYASTAAPDTWMKTGITLSNISFPIVDAVVAHWNTALVPAGRYTLRLTATALGKVYRSTISVDLTKQLTGKYPISVKEANQISVDDIDEDGNQELIVMEREKLDAFNINGDQISSKFPVAIESPYSYHDFYRKIASVGNINGNPLKAGKEILYNVARFSGSFFFYSIYAIYNDGTAISGWPESVLAGDPEINNVPLADINGDGYDDVVFLSEGSSNNVVLKAVDGSGNTLPGWSNVVVDSQKDESFGLPSMPVVGNINFFPDNEVVVDVAEGGTRKVKAYSSFGQKLWEFAVPKASNEIVHEGYVAIGDINGDNIGETIALYGIENTSSGSERLLLWVLDANGNPMSGFNPFNPGINDVEGSVVLGDLNDDGNSDIVISTPWQGKFVAVDHNANVLPGFPYLRPMLAAAITTVADVDGDGNKEILLYGKENPPFVGQQTTNLVDLLTYDHVSGTLNSFPSFPKYFGQTASPFSHAITDLDGDGKTELAVLVNYQTDQQLFVFNLGTDLGETDWPQGLHDARHSGSNTDPSLFTAIPDANGDGQVDMADYVIWLNHYNQTTSLGKREGDFNLDNFVDGTDYMIWYLYFGQ
jgi:subtilisin family serine protease